MKNKVLSIALVSATISFSAFSQNTQPISGVGAEQNLEYLGRVSNEPGRMVRLYDNRYQGIKGTPYFWPGWAKASISSNTTTFQGVKVKYNVYENHLLYLNDSQQPRVLDPYRVDSFELTDSMGLNVVKFQKLPALASLDPAYANQFAQIIYEKGPEKLAALHSKRILKADFKDPYSPNRTSDEFIEQTTAFYFNGDHVQEVKLNKRNFYALFPAKQKQTEEFIKANAVDLKTLQGWARALKFYQNLN